MLLSLNSRGQDIPPCEISINQFGATVVCSPETILADYVKGKEQGLHNTDLSALKRITSKLQSEMAQFKSDTLVHKKASIALAFDNHGNIAYVRIIIQPDSIRVFTTNELKHLYNLIWNIKYPVIPDKTDKAYYYLGGFTVTLYP